MENEKVIRTIIVQSDELTRKVTKCMCSFVSNLAVYADFDNAEEALSFSANNAVDLVILDMWLPAMSGIDAANVFKYINPKIKIVMIIPEGPELDSCVLSSIAADANAYLLKDFDTNQIRKVVSTIFSGGYWIDYRFQYSVFGIMSFLPKSDIKYFRSLLTPEESSIIYQVLQGVTKDEISKSLNLQSVDLSHCIKSIFKKLSKTSSVELLLRRVCYDLF